ncbi:unnamed protein product [Blepharisma stoltei]|uniref:Uncharacterized protein n=1 Tax=Blepharisma stoltei TaxID=1481888 RepID=A0AAU9IYN1_9CILI|nr:unnamed protein product [Blepharisma stoltei]
MRSRNDKSQLKQGLSSNSIFPLSIRKDAETPDGFRRYFQSLHNSQKSVKSPTSALSPCRLNHKYLRSQYHLKDRNIADKLLNQILRLYSQTMQKTPQAENLHTFLNTKSQPSYSLSCSPLPKMKKREQIQQFNVLKASSPDNLTSKLNIQSSLKKLRHKKMSSAILRCMKIEKIEKNEKSESVIGSPCKSPLNYRICEMQKKSSTSLRRTVEMTTSTSHLD